MCLVPHFSNEYNEWARVCDRPVMRRIDIISSSRAGAASIGPHWEADTSVDERRRAAGDIFLEKAHTLRGMERYVRKADDNLTSLPRSVMAVVDKICDDINALTIKFSNTRLESLDVADAIVHIDIIGVPFHKLYNELIAQLRKAVLILWPLDVANPPPKHATLIDNILANIPPPMEWKPYRF